VVDQDEVVVQTEGRRPRESGDPVTLRNDTGFPLSDQNTRE
jgi:hypothetical protein